MQEVQSKWASVHRRRTNPTFETENDLCVCNGSVWYYCWCIRYNHDHLLFIKLIYFLYLFWCKKKREQA